MDLLRLRRYWADSQKSPRREATRCFHHYRCFFLPPLLRNSPLSKALEARNIGWFCSSWLQYDHLPFSHRAQRRRRRRFWHWWTDKLLRTISLSTSTWHLWNQKCLYQWFLFVHWSVFQFHWITAPHCSKDYSSSIVNSPHCLVQDEQLLGEWHSEKCSK